MTFLTAKSGVKGNIELLKYKSLSHPIGAVNPAFLQKEKGFVIFLECVILPNNEFVHAVYRTPDSKSSSFMADYLVIRSTASTPKSEAFVLTKS
ncbi:hypothetical protein RRG08_025193 [Elysia crispata]|uniref:Uncharacterized protein n=1 Tax=Elysia crispata TaxID=231223 RepID=A0AAE1AAH6_9GAST|nr:hypothetical protein RRG08_025193 [Elysia crispata]